MLKHDYESTFIIRPDLDEAEHNRVKERLEGVIAAGGGEVLMFDDWGRRKLAYTVKKHQFGHYLHWNYVAPADVPAELERIVKIEESIVRFLTIKLADMVDVDERRAIAEERKRKRDAALAAEAARAAEQAERAERSEADNDSGAATPA
jgi:small subunit ribosomal protein S6